MNHNFKLLESLLKLQKGLFRSSLGIKFKFCQPQYKARSGFSKTKYSDKHILNEDEISQILLKQQARPTLIISQQNEDNPRYEMDINQQIQQVKDFSKPSFSNNEVSKQELATPTNQKLSERSDSNSLTKSQSQELESQAEVPAPEIKYYQYNLPIPNIPDQIKPYQDPLEKEEVETLNMRMWEILRLNQNSSYQQYELELRNKFNSELDMYGNVEDQVEIRENQIKLLQENSVPKYLINDEQYMERVIRNTLLNLNMPGTMEAEHPHKFLQNLRPLDEFRHTPLIPISERQMREHQAQVDAYHRKGFFFEIQQESIFNYLFAAIVGGICFQMIMMALERDQESTIAIQRYQIQRSQNTSNFSGEDEQ